MSGARIFLDFLEFIKGIWRYYFNNAKSIRAYNAVLIVSSSEQSPSNQQFLAIPVSPGIKGHSGFYPTFKQLLSVLYPADILH